jgi:hypothetical protein
MRQMYLAVDHLRNQTCTQTTLQNPSTEQQTFSVTILAALMLDFQTITFPSRPPEAKYSPCGENTTACTA